MDTFVARQPIFDAQLGVFAYELLFRSGPENFFPNVDGDLAASRVITDSSSVFGLDTLTAGRPAFINATRRVLTENLFSLLPNEWAVVEVLETVEPDREVVDACRALKDAGYMLALDDFVDSRKYKPLIELADIIKVDFLASDKPTRRALAERYGSQVRLLAEKVETHEDVRDGVGLGYDLFQGFFFCEPEIISRRQVPGFKLNYIRFLKEVSRPELDFDRLEEIIEQEVSLSVKLLRLLNSAAFGFSGTVNSVRQALLLLGEQSTKKWASMIALGEMGDDKPRELVFTCLLRARMCELAAYTVGLRAMAQDLFLVGMLSLIDVLIGRPVEELLEEMAVSEAIKEAVLEDRSPMGQVRSLVTAYERGQWERFERCAEEISVPQGKLTAAYNDALSWANQVFEAEPAVA